MVEASRSMGKHGISHGLVDHYSKLANDGPMVASDYVDVAVLDALADVVEFVVKAIEDPVAPRWIPIPFLCVLASILIELVGGQKADIVLFVIG